MNEAIRHSLAGYDFEWYWKLDSARLARRASDAIVWTGSLLPAIHTTEGAADRILTPSDVKLESIGANRAALTVYYDEVCTGTLALELSPDGIAFRRFELQWRDVPRPIKAIYFGASALGQEEQLATYQYGVKSWSTWRAQGFCIPGAKSNPGQSFWRMWDMGNAVLPLGSFGPAMGSPYAAAFPRPTLAAAMGGDAGWMVVGPGEVPPAAVSLDIQGSTAQLRLLFREDLCGTVDENPRIFEEPLRLTWSANPWDGFRLFYKTFPAPPRSPSAAQYSQMGTWGSFKEGIYDLENEHARCSSYGFANLQIDDGWETWKGSGIVNELRFPNFVQKLAIWRSKGLKIGLWQSIGWVAEPAAVRLTAKDLLCGPDGRPRLASWNFDPASDQAIYCLDPSSNKTRDFLAERTRRTIRQYRPDLLKLDFGYGLPGPDAASPREPSFRGERYCLELLRIIAEAARAENPAVALEYYGIHPLFRRYYDIVSLDDLGDMGYHEAEGHHQRSVWASLTAGESAIMATSGYLWAACDEILLNTVVLGAPGLCVAEVDAAGEKVCPRTRARIRAINRWHRRRTGWMPLWLNSHHGSFRTEPRLVCWGRVEGESNVVALALRENSAPPDLSRWGISGWSGRWVVLSLDDAGIETAAQVVCIPFDVGFIRWRHPAARVYRIRDADNGITESEEISAGLQVEVLDLQDLDSLMGYILER